MKTETLRKPHWLKIKLDTNQEYRQVSLLVKENGLNTICASGRCPNMNECWSRGTATFMILGNICTRRCKFCATATGKPLDPDPKEPQKIANSVAIMKLKHCVITSVDRDDLPDGGASHWAETIKAIRAKNPSTTIEVLIPDMDAKHELLDIIIAARPDIIGHNIETVERITPIIRSKAKYNVSLDTLKHISSSDIVTKSGLMLGVGETNLEIIDTLRDLRAAGCEIITMGQYLQPTRDHHPVDRYVSPEMFEELKAKALSMDFAYVESGPLVRSSYMADKAINSATKKRLGL